MVRELCIAVTNDGLFLNYRWTTTQLRLNKSINQSITQQIKPINQPINYTANITIERSQLFKEAFFKLKKWKIFFIY